MYADYHVHTEYSDDSLYPMEEVVRDAIRLGLDEICFTDMWIMALNRTGTVRNPLSGAGAFGRTG